VLLLTGLLKLAEAPARAQLQRVLLNLCAHPESRKQVMQILMSMLRAPLSADEAAEASQVSLHCSQQTYSHCGVGSLVSSSGIFSSRIFGGPYFVILQHPQQSMAPYGPPCLSAASGLIPHSSSHFSQHSSFCLQRSHVTLTVSSGAVLCCHCLQFSSPA